MVYNNTIISLRLIVYYLIIANSGLRPSFAIYQTIYDSHSRDNFKSSNFNNISVSFLPRVSKEKGFCVTSNGRDQNGGVIKLNSLDGNTSERQAKCLGLCYAKKGATGCEVIWNQRNRGFYVHTQEVARGNGVRNHACWIFSKLPKENGFCVTSNGRDQNSGVIKLNSLDGNTAVRQARCLRLCHAYKRTTGCEEIWHQRNRGCYVHTEEVARGNGRRNHACWIFPKRE